MAEEKKKRISGIFVIAIVAIALIRIAMVLGRDAPNSTHQAWDNTLLYWSGFIVLAVVGSYFYQERKNAE